MSKYLSFIIVFPKDFKALFTKLSDLNNFEHSFEMISNYEFFFKILYFIEWKCELQITRVAEGRNNLGSWI